MKALRSFQSTVYRERALLAAIVPTAEPRINERFHADPSSAPIPEPLEELGALSEAAGAEVVGWVLQRRDQPDPRTIIGEGKVGEVEALISERRADVVILDHDLTPAQVRTLEGRLKTKVLDRTELILDIFATHARTGEAKLQVELAQLQYNLPRLKRLWTHLGQQVAGGGGAIGGIGTRGPGEKQIEVDRRIARRRIHDLREELQRIEGRKQREVEVRTGENYTVSLVGYTNAGKSTLMNRLTGAGVLVEDRPFSTLDTRTRLWHVAKGMDVLLSDTVGFIRKLPHHLIASFHATLEEVTQADLLLHVADASHPDLEDQIGSVREVLEALQCSGKETVMVLNKVDRLRDSVEREILRRHHPDAVQISAATGEGLDLLRARIESAVRQRLQEMEVEVPLSEGKLLAEIDSCCEVLNRDFMDGHVRMRLRVPRRRVWRLSPFQLQTAAVHRKK